jgi:POT family proton-dependent oligopeptide transporter
MPTSVALFIKHNVDRVMFGYEIPYSSFILLNPLFIAILAPLFMYVFKRFPSTHATKFTLGMFLCSFAFFILFMSKSDAANGIISPVWIIISYALQSGSEICVSAIGLAMITQLSPIKISGVATGVWFLSSMLGGKFAGVISQLSAVSDENRTVTDSLNIYTDNFFYIGLVVVICALIMLCFVPILNKIIKS